MQAIRVHQFGGPDVLRVEDVPVPEPGPGEALIKVEASGINFVDVYHRTGLYPGQLPPTLGREAAGTVERIGAGVTTCRPGDRVVSETVRGAYAQYALAAAERLVPVPDRVTSRQAAAVLLQGMTAQYLAYATYRLAPGDTCLVHAAAGGVGLLLCQIASRIGARVIGTGRAWNIVQLGLWRVGSPFHLRRRILVRHPVRFTDGQIAPTLFGRTRGCYGRGGGQQQHEH